MSHTDKLGKHIKVRDIVVTGSGSYADISIGVVTKLNAIMLQVNGTSQGNPKESLVITSMYKAEYPHQYKGLMDRFKDKFDETTKVVRPKRRYMLKVLKHNISDKVDLVVITVVDGKSESWGPLGDHQQYSSMEVVRRSKDYYSGTVTDDLYLTGQYNNDKFKFLPAKFIRQVVGGVPTQNEVVERFNNLDECKEYLTQNGVEV